MDMNQPIGYKCTALPLKIAFLNGAHKNIVASTLKGQLQFFFGSAEKKSQRIVYNLSDSIVSMQ